MIFIIIFKNSPNRQKSYEDLQAFVQCEPHKILKPCQTRWLSVAQCVNRILEQWNALELFFVPEAAETKSPTAERILNALRSKYVKAFVDVDHVTIVKGKADVKYGGVLASKLPRRLSQCCGVQTIDRQWRSLLVDEDVKKGGWETRPSHDFWKAMADIEPYKELATFMLEITALPQSTAVVERTFSKLNNKTKLRNALGVCTMEATVKVSEEFPSNFDSNKRLAELHSKA